MSTKKKSRPLRLLAIDPGTRYLGVAVFEGRDLVDHMVKGVRDKNTTKVINRVRSVLVKLIDRYQVEALVLEGPYYAQSKTSKGMKAMIQAIKALVRKRKLRFYSLSPLMVKRHLCPQGKAVRMEAARVIAECYYPWLWREYEKERARSWWRDHYHLRVFNAVALGLYCLDRYLDRGRSL